MEERGFWGRLKALTGFLAAIAAAATALAHCAGDSSPPSERSATSPPVQVYVQPAAAEPAAPAQTVSAAPAPRPAAASICATAELNCQLNEVLPPGVACYCHMFGMPVALGVTR